MDAGKVQKSEISQIKVVAKEIWLVATGPVVDICRVYIVPDGSTTCGLWWCEQHGCARTLVHFSDIVCIKVCNCPKTVILGSHIMVTIATVARESLNMPYLATYGPPHSQTLSPR
jgi:hypothetical protein